MKEKNLILFLAWRKCIRDKKNLIVLVLGIAISITIIMIGSSSNNKLIKTQQDSKKQITGDWHMAFLYDDDSVLAEIKAVKGVKEIYQCFYIPDVISKDVSETFQVLAINKDKLSKFVKSNKEYPKDQDEILLPQWFLDKYNISDLPYELDLNGESVSVVGSFDVDYQRTSNNTPVYITYEDNQDLQQYSELRMPWGYMHETDSEDTSYKAQKIVLISLKEKTNVNKVARVIEDIDGIYTFPLKEAYGITDYSKENTPWFNGELISLENIRNAGSLTEDGSYIGQKRLSYIYEVIIIIISILFVISFINLKKDDILHQSGILQTMGISLKELLTIELVYLLIVILLASPLGLGLGALVSLMLNSFQYIELGKVISSICIMGFCLIISGLLLIAYSIIINPIESMQSGPSKQGNQVKKESKSRLINSKGGFRLSYAVRNISLFKNRYLVYTFIIGLLFTVFVICLTIINLFHITGQGKSKYDYDFLIEKESLETTIDDARLTRQLKEIQGYKEILSPLCYKHDDMEREREEIIVKIPKEKLTAALIQKLLLSNPEDYVENDYPYVMNKTGIIGCNKEELDYLEKYLVEGSIEDMYDGSKPYVLLPKYFESYENNNIAMTKFNLGDKIQICLTKKDTDNLDPEFKIEKEFVIAGFIDVNPFYMSNGVSSEFSVLVNREQLQTIVPATVSYTYIKVDENFYDDFADGLESLELESKGYKIKEARDNIDDYMRKKTEDNEKEIILALVIGTSVVIILGIANLIFSNKMLREDEIRLLRIIGLSAKNVESIDLIETMFYNIVGIILGIFLSGIIINRMNLDAIYKNIWDIPWSIWLGTGFIMLMVSMLFSVITSLYMEKRLDMD